MLLKQRGVTEIDKIRIDLDPAQRDEMMAKTGRRTVPQARHMPNSGFAAQADALAKEAMTGKEPKPVILMCAAGWRSLQSGKRLRKAGLQEVYSLDGGFDAWKQAGLPIKKA